MNVNEMDIPYADEDEDLQFSEDVLEHSLDQNRAKDYYILSFDGIFETSDERDQTRGRHNETKKQITFGRTDTNVYDESEDENNNYQNSDDTKGSSAIVDRLKMETQGNPKDELRQNRSGNPVTQYYISEDCDIRGTVDTTCAMDNLCQEEISSIGPENGIDSNGRTSGDETAPEDQDADGSMNATRYSPRMYDGNNRRLSADYLKVDTNRNQRLLPDYLKLKTSENNRRLSPDYLKVDNNRGSRYGYRNGRDLQVWGRQNFTHYDQRKHTRVPVDTAAGDADIGHVVRSTNHRPGSAPPRYSDNRDLREMFNVGTSDHSSAQEKEDVTEWADDTSKKHAYSYKPQSRFMRSNHSEKNVIDKDNCTEPTKTTQNHSDSEKFITNRPTPSPSLPSTRANSIDSGYINIDDVSSCNDGASSMTSSSRSSPVPKQESLTVSQQFESLLMQHQDVVGNDHGPKIPDVIAPNVNNVHMTHFDSGNETVISHPSVSKEHNGLSSGDSNLTNSGQQPQDKTSKILMSMFNSRSEKSTLDTSIDTRSIHSPSEANNDICNINEKLDQTTQGYFSHDQQISDGINSVYSGHSTGGNNVELLPRSCLTNCNNEGFNEAGRGEDISHSLTGNVEPERAFCYDKNCINNCGKKYHPYKQREASVNRGEHCVTGACEADKMAEERVNRRVRSIFTRPRPPTPVRSQGERAEDTQRAASTSTPRQPRSVQKRGGDKSKITGSTAPDLFESSQLHVPARYSNVHTRGVTATGHQSKPTGSSTTRGGKRGGTGATGTSSSRKSTLVLKPSEPKREDRTQRRIRTITQETTDVVRTLSDVEPVSVEATSRHNNHGHTVERTMSLDEQTIHAPTESHIELHIVEPNDSPAYTVEYPNGDNVITALSDDGIDNAGDDMCQLLTDSSSSGTGGIQIYRLGSTDDESSEIYHDAEADTLGDLSDDPQLAPELMDEHGGGNERVSDVMDLEAEDNVTEEERAVLMAMIEGRLDEKVIPPFNQEVEPPAAAQNVHISVVGPEGEVIDVDRRSSDGGGSGASDENKETQAQVEARARLLAQVRGGITKRVIPRKRTIIVDEEMMEELFLRCIICRDRYDTEQQMPKLLPCHHTFCLQCLKEMFRVEAEYRNSLTAAFQNNPSFVSILCPTCRQTHMITDRNYRDLKSDYKILELLELTARPTKGVAGYCKRHRTQPLNHFCETCVVPVCSDCRVLDHSETDNHTVLNRKDALVKYADDIKETMKEVADEDDELQRIEKSLKDAIQNIDDKLGDTVGNIRGIFNKFKTGINERQDQLMERIENQVGKRKREFGTDLEEVTSRIEKMETTREMLTQAKDDEDVEQMFVSQKSAREMFKSEVDLKQDTSKSVKASFFYEKRERANIMSTISDHGILMFQS